MEKLRDLDKIFTYKVSERSSELQTDITLDRDMQVPLIFNETSCGKIVFKPSRPITSCYLICSHSHIFGFQQKAIPVPEQGNEMSLDLQLRATKIGDINVKFMVRYEVADAESPLSQFRFKRMELNLHVKELF